MSRSFLTVICIACAIVSSLLSHSTPGWSAAVTLECSLGFNGYFQLKTWTPLTVVLENRGRAIIGTVEVIVTSGSEYRQDIHQQIYSTDIDLPYNSKKLCTFTIFIESFTHELHIRVKQADNILETKSIDLRSFYSVKPFALVVDYRTSPDMLSVLPDALSPVNIHPEFLPETWYGYDSIAMLIMNADMLKRLRDRQFQALTDWLKRGGWLVMTGGTNYGVLSDRRIQQLLPIKIAGLRQVSALTAFENFCGAPLISSTPFLVLHGILPQSQAVLQEGGIPLILEHAIGNGKIVFLAFDIQQPPFSRWSQRTAFWQTIFTRNAASPFEAGSGMLRRGVELSQQKIVEGMIANMPTRFPNPKSAAIFVGVYFFLLLWFLKRIQKRHGKTWKNIGALLATIVIFCLASYGLFFFRNAQKSLSYNSFSYVHFANQRPVALGKTFIGLYSIQRSRYDLNFGSTMHPIIPLFFEQPNQKIPQKYSLHEQASEQHILGVAEKWSHAIFAADTAIEFPMAMQAASDARQFRIAVQNLTPYLLNGCQVYFQRRLFVIGEIAPHQESITEISRADIERQEAFNPDRPQPLLPNMAMKDASPFLTSMQEQLIWQIVSSIDAQIQGQENIAYIIGWTSAEIIPLQFGNPDIAGEHLTLITWAVPVTQNL